MDNILSQNELIVISLSISAIFLSMLIVLIIAVLKTNKSLATLQEIISKPNIKIIEKLSEKFNDLPAIINISSIQKSTSKSILEEAANIKKVLSESLAIQNKNAESQNLLTELISIISTSEKQLELSTHIESIKDTLSEIVELETL